VLGIEPARLAALGGRFRRLSFSGGRTAPPVPPTVAGSIVQHGWRKSVVIWNWWS